MNSLNSDVQGLSGSDIMIIGGNSHPDLVNLIAKYVPNLKLFNF